jgi:hypothetical protein
MLKRASSFFSFPPFLSSRSEADEQCESRFAAMGFPHQQVIETLKFLNYRDGNRENVGEDAVVSRLFG